MSMDLLVRLPDPEEIKKKYPASEKVKKIKAQRDKEIADVFTGKSNKFLLIIGPCSADKEEPVLDYFKACTRSGAGKGQDTDYTENLHEQAPYHRRRI